MCVLAGGMWGRGEGRKEKDGIQIPFLELPLLSVLFGNIGLDGWNVILIKVIYLNCSPLKPNCHATQ